MEQQTWSAEDCDRTLPFERRAGERVDLSGGAMAAFYDEDGAFGLTRVELVDTSGAGIGMRCPVQVAPGVRFSLYSGSIPLPHQTGIVVRCSREGEEFRIGLRCDRRKAA